MLLGIGRIGRWVTLVAVLAAPLLFLAVLRLGTDERIAAVEARPAPLVTAPTARTILDERRVTGTVAWQEGLALRAPEWRGIVTAVHLKPGDTVTSGQRLVDVAGVGRLAVASAFPFYRSLQWGSVGADVAELHRVLVALGYLEAVPPDEQAFGFGTRQAVVALERDLGISLPTGIFDPGWFAWLPIDPFEVGEVKLTAGAQAPGAGTAFATEPPRLASVILGSGGGGEQLVLDPAVAWVLVVRGQGFPVDAATLRVRDEALPALAELLAPAAERVDGELRRANPLEVLAVPSTAVTTGPQGTLCVWLEEAVGYRAAPVTVAGARAGVASIASGLRSTDRVLANPAQVLEQPACP
jgi:hypothetical protein